MTLIRQAFVLLLAGLLATLAILASDELNSAKNSLLGALGKAERQETGLCPSEMVAVNTSDGVLCVDRYEVSPGKACVHESPKNQQETVENISWPGCIPVSEKGKYPWTNLALHEAATLCSRAGKRLPSSLEWYKSALGTPDPYGSGRTVCNINAIGSTEPAKTGAFSECLSSAGASDMIGNVWEWVDETAVNSTLSGRTMPENGYVIAVDEAGVPTATGEEPSLSYGGDYFWADQSDVRGVFRGGFWGLDERVGLYAVNATVPTSFTGVGVGFRCVK